MCTLVVLRRPEHPWPLLVGGNRDEMQDRAWLAPARHWEDRPEVVGGLDQQAGGSWFGLNDHGLVAVVMNREGTLGPREGMRSRGELVLEALEHAEAEEAARALADLAPESYRAFNLFVGDPVHAYWLRHRGQQGPGHVEVFDVPAGCHMLAAGELDDRSHPRIRSYLPRFRDADAPDPQQGVWDSWIPLLASRLYPEQDGPRAAMSFQEPDGFGTVCSQLAAIPRYPGFENRPRLWFAAGPPHRTPFEPVSI